MTSNNAAANTILFADFCAVLEKLHKRKNHKPDQLKIISNFFNEFRMKIAGNKNSSIFPVLRLLLPKEERERSAYNLKQSRLSELLIKVLSLSKQSEDAKKLLNFTAVSDASDFAGVAYFVLNSRIPGKSSTLTIGEVNDILDRLATDEVGKGPIQDQAMSDAIKNLSADQMKWFLRIILKDLKLAMGTRGILNAFHPDASELFDNCASLAKVCEDLDDGDTRPPELGIQVFFAVCPMLSERLDVRHLSKLPQNKTYQIESKFDGERFQVHMVNGKFEYFSRKGYSWSDTYGKTYDSTGLLTPYLKDCFSVSINSIILDGEMMGWHKYYQCFGSKGMAFDIKKITENSRYRPCFCVFDVLYYNGKTLVGPADKGGMPLSKRLKLLDDMFTDVPGVIQHSKRTIVEDNMQILDALNKAIDDEEEGIVVKDTESYYIANRRNAGWYKIKPEYTDSTMTDLDLVIIGADEAENKRQGRARSFLIACADRLNPGEPPHRWVCVGRVATGLSHAERERVCAALERHWVRAQTTPPPHTLVFNKEKPDFWIMPEHSIVLQVRATELIRSTHFGSEYTLRFPRVMRIRDDKPASDVMTLDEYNCLATDKKAVAKLSTKRINEGQIAEDVQPRKKRTAKVLEVPEQFRIKASGDVEVTSKALLGRKIYIMSDDDDCKKPELIRILESHGGKHVENIGTDTWCCVAGRQIHRVRMHVQKQDLDIITTSWLRALPNSETLCTLSPLDMLSIKPTTKLNLSLEYDSFGDSYSKLLDEDNLKKCFKKMENDEPEIYLTKEEMLNVDKELFGDHNPFSFLRPFCIHFVNTNSLNVLYAKMYGATVCDIDSPNLTHVAIPQRTEIEHMDNIRNTIYSGIFVSEEWLEACFAEEKLVPEAKYLV